MTQAAVAPAAQRSMSAADWAKLLLLGAIWGGSFFFARIAVAEMHPLALVLFRVLIAAAALHVYLLARGPSFRLALPLAGSFFVLALVNNVLPFSLIFAGQTEMGAGLAAVLNSTTPFWTILIANAVTADEKLSVNKVAGVLLGIAGGTFLKRRERTCLDGGPRPGSGLDGVRLHPLFQRHRIGRRHQRLAGDADRAGQRHPARLRLSRRTAGIVRGRRNAADWAWTRDHRRAGLQATLGDAARHPQSRLGVAGRPSQTGHIFSTTAETGIAYKFRRLKRIGRSFLPQSRRIAAHFPLACCLKSPRLSP